MTKIQVDSNGKAIMLNGKALEASEGVTPTGTLSITANGVYDVTNYASADVSVAGGGTATLTIVPANLESAPYTSSQILVNDNLKYYSSGDFTSMTTITATVPKGLVTVTCLAYLGNYVAFSLANTENDWEADWIATPFHEQPGDVAVISKTLEITENMTLYLTAIH